MRQKRYAVLVGVPLFALLSGAFMVFENFSGRFGDSAARIAQGALAPGWSMDVLASGNFHAGFGAGDWRDFTVMVLGSWFVWMTPIVLISRALERGRKQPNQTLEPTAAAGRGSS